MTITLMLTFLILLVLKTAEILAISWLVVFSPIIIFVFLTTLGAALGALILHLIKRIEKVKNEIQ